MSVALTNCRHALNILREQINERGFPVGDKQYEEFYNLFRRYEISFHNAVRAFDKIYSVLQDQEDRIRKIEGDLWNKQNSGTSQREITREPSYLDQA